MNQKVSKMLRTMRTDTKRHKRMWNNLSHTERGQIRQGFLNHQKVPTVPVQEPVTTEEPVTNEI